jgi:quaternary ammonium compound-resistance protein SugE
VTTIDGKAAWAVLAIAGLLEIVWATALKESDGFSRLWPSVISVATALLSFGLLALALEQLPVGTAYAVWVGIGATGVAVAGMVWFGDPAGVLRLACIGLVVLGIVGLRLLEE